MSNQGKQYELQISRVLKASGLLYSSFRPAGDDNSLPDCKIKIRDKYFRIELKHSTNAYFGQGGIKYDLKTEEWVLSEQQSTLEAREFRNYMTEMRALDKINAVWKKYGPPRTTSIPPRLLTKSDVDTDKNNFKESHSTQPIDISSIFRYYASKNVYYIQIGGLGLYHMAGDPADIKVPQLSGTFELTARIKAETKPDGKVYSRFSFGIKPKKLTPQFGPNSLDLDDPEHRKILASTNTQK